MSGRTIAIAVVVLVVVLCLVVALGAGAYWYFSVPPVEAAEKPTVSIDSPGHGDEVTIGEAVQISATARDPTKIERIEIWIDGQPEQSQDSALPGGTSPFPIMFMWAPDTPGNHTVVVRAYNMAGESGQASVAVTAVEGPEIPAGCEGEEVFEHEVQMGETVEGIAGGYDVTVEQIVACNPGLDPTVMPDPGTILLIPSILEPGEQERPPDLPPPDDAEQPPEAPPEAEELPGEELPPAEEEPPPGEEAPPEVEEPPEEAGPPPEPPEPEVPTVTLAFEALELEVDQAYDNVYCMVQLADAPMEHVPEAGSFTPVGGNYWDIQAELAGMNSRQVEVVGDTLRVEAECFGWIGINGWSLGHFIREHGDAEWTGEEIEVTAIADDGKWFRVVYRICPDFPCEPRPVPPAPTNLHSFTFWGFHFVGWDYEVEDEDDIDGFRLYRDDVMIYQLAHPAWRAMIAMPVAVPCGTDYTYHVTAYRGFPGVGPESDPSNTVTRSGDPCPRTVAVTFETLHTGCMAADTCPDPHVCSTCIVSPWVGGVAANSESITRVWPPVHVPWIRSFAHQSVAEMFGGYDTVALEMDPADNLTIEIQLYDYDGFWVLTPLCLGSRVLEPDEIETGTYLLYCEGDPSTWATGLLELHLDVSP